MEPGNALQPKLVYIVDAGIPTRRPPATGIFFLAFPSLTKRDTFISPSLSMILFMKNQLDEWPQIISYC